MKLGKRIIGLCMCFVISALMMFGGKSTMAYSVDDTCYLERADKGFYTIQRWNGSEWIYITYSITNYVDERGNKQVAYCVNPDRKGIGYISGEFSGYDVQIKNLISDEKCWRVLKNGYPYKSPADLGVENEQDAYLATKMAVYAMLRGNNEDDIRSLYRAGVERVAGQSPDEVQRRGNKVIDAICNLVNIGNNESELMKFSNVIEIRKDGEFEPSKKHEGYYCQRMQVGCDVDNWEYSVKSIAGFPTGTIITDLNGHTKTTFKGGDEFIIEVPKEALMENIAGKVVLTCRCENYPIYYAECNDGVHQNYYLCCDSYSDVVECSSDVNIEVRKSNLRIVKKDKETGKPISNVKFSVKYKDGLEIGTFVTDEDGIISIDNLHQGSILVKELECPDEYELLNDEMCVEIEYNDSKELVVEDELKEVPEETPEEEQPEKTVPEEVQPEEEKNVEKLPRTGMADYNVFMVEIAAICLAVKRLI